MKKHEKKAKQPIVNDGFGRRDPLQKPADFSGTALRLIKELRAFKWLVAVVIGAGLISQTLTITGPNLLGFGFLAHKKISEIEI